MKHHAQRPTLRHRISTGLCWLLLVPALAGPIAAQPVAPEPKLTRAAAVIDWPITGEEYIVVSPLDEVTGPWYPCLDPIARRPGVFQTAVRFTDHSIFFKLAAGRWFMDDFNDGLFTGWSEFRYETGFDIVSIVEADGRLRISGDCATCNERGVYFYRNETATADVAASIDILGYSTSLIRTFRPKPSRPSIMVANR